MKLALVLYRRRVDPIICNLQSFYPIWNHGVTNLDQNWIFLLVHNLINPIILHKKTPWLLRFQNPNVNFKVIHVKATVVWISTIPSFVHFLHRIYLRYDIIAWWDMRHVVGEGDLTTSFFLTTTTTVTTLRTIQQSYSISVITAFPYLKMIFCYTQTYFLRSPINKKQSIIIMW